MGTRGMTLWWFAITVTATGACGRRPEAQPMDASGGGVADASVDARALPPDALTFVCDPIPPPPTLPLPLPPAAGTRLVPRTIAEPVPGGLEVPWAVHDTLLDVDCEPTRYVDGKILCMPSLSSVRQLAAALYVDIAGKIQVTLEPLQSAPTPGTVVGLSVPVANPAFDTMFPCSGFGLELLVTGLPRSETQYYTRTHGATPVPPGYGLYDVFPLTGAYVELDEVRAQISRSVAIRELHGADGSRVFPRGLYDTAHDVMIESVGEYNALQMLLPPKVDRTNTHLIPAQPPNEAWCARSDPLFITQSQSGCDYSGLRFVNDPQTHLAYQVTRRTGTTYLCVTGESGPWLYEERDPFLARCAAPDFDGQVITWVTIGARITKQAVKIEDTTVLPPGGSSFTDSALHVSCNPTVASDGVLRCLPSEAWIVYTDPACTSPVAATFDPKPTYASQGSVPGSSPIDRQGQIAMFSVGAARPAGPVYALTRDGCAAFGTMPSFEISELSASTFAALEIRDVPASARSAQRAARP